MAAGTLGTNYGEAFGRNSLKLYFESAIAPKISNNKWEGEVKGGRGDRVNILTYGLNPWENYTGADITFNDISEVEGQLVLDKQRNNSFRIKDWDNFKSYATDVESTELQSVAALLKSEVDEHILSFVDDAAAGNRIGTDYTTGTVEIAATTGAVTGTGTTFTAAMVGKSFRAAGHTADYRVKTYTSATAIVIEDDSDDNVSAYTGGAISALATYVIQAVTPVTLTKDTIDAQILKVKEVLDRKHSDGTVVPKKDRFIVIPSKVESMLLQSGLLVPYTPSAYEDVVKLGIIGMYRGFKVYVNEEVAGNNTDGYRILAGHPMGITHAFVQIASETVRLESNYGKGLKQLVAYGSKVLDARRKALAMLFAKV